MRSKIKERLQQIKKVRADVIGVTPIIKKTPKIKGVKEILYPGQRKYRNYLSNLKKDISFN